jgi:hypothetical protein
MSMAAGNGPGFHVHMSQQTRARVMQYHLIAAAAGQGHQFLAAFRQIIERLRHAPGEFGEPVYSLHALSLQIRKGVVRPLCR